MTRQSSQREKRGERISVGAWGVWAGLWGMAALCYGTVLDIQGSFYETHKDGIHGFIFREKEIMVHSSFVCHHSAKKGSRRTNLLRGANLIIASCYKQQSFPNAMGIFLSHSSFLNQDK